MELAPIAISEPGVTEGAFEHRDQPVGGSLLDSIRARHAKLAADDAQHELFDIPGYDGQLVARYRRLTFEEMTEVRRHATNVVEYNADFLTAACDELLFCDRDGNLVAPSDTGPVRYDRQWAELLGLQLPDGAGAREVVRATVALGDHALNDHSGEVSEWMRTGEAPERRLLGESSARPKPAGS